MNKSILIKAGLFTLTCLPVLSQATTAPASQAATPTNQTSQPAPVSLNPGPVIINNTATTNTNNTTTPSAEPTTASQTAPTNPTAATAAAAAAADAAKTTTTSPTTPEQTSAPTAIPPQSTTPNSTPTNNTPTTVSTAATPLDCNYHIPPTTSAIDNNLVLQWGQKAAQQTFTFTPSTLDSQLTLLKSCYTEQGWQSFNDALQKSGNLDAIKKENLTVSSMIDGQATITPTKNNQWKLTVPMQIVYQNEKEKIVQSLSIHMTISRKISGDLGVMQVVAIPKQVNTTDAPATPSSTTTDSNAAATTSTSKTITQPATNASTKPTTISPAPTTPPATTTP